MNPFNINHIKIEKANSIKQRNQKLRKISNFFRIFEILIIVVVISRISFQLPITLAFKLFHDYLHKLSLILVSPQFVFVLGNAIVITLLINSGRFNNKKYYVKPLQTLKHAQYKKITKPQPKIVFDRKENILHKNDRRKLNCLHAKGNHILCNQTEPTTKKPEQNPVKVQKLPAQETQVVKVYHRSKSEKVTREIMEKGFGQLRRSNTAVKSLKSYSSSDARERHYPEDTMSNEEFRRTIENFIAKQQRFLRQEEGI